MSPSRFTHEVAMSLLGIEGKPTCQSCPHWFKMPTPAEDVSHVTGQCRGVPPGATAAIKAVVHPVHGLQLQVLGSVVGYSEVAPDTDACRLHPRYKPTQVQEAG
jgi:hypothetical protein